MKKIKKYIPLFVVLGVILLFVLLAVLNNNASVKLESEDLQTWLKDTKKDEYVVTVFAQTYCSHCQNYKPVMEEVQNEYGFNLKWIELDLLSDNDKRAVVNIYPLEEADGTPDTFITKNGELLREISGEVSKQRLINELTKIGVIKSN